RILFGQSTSLTTLVSEPRPKVWTKSGNQGHLSSPIFPTQTPGARCTELAFRRATPRANPASLLMLVHLDLSSAESKVAPPSPGTSSANSPARGSKLRF